jgi:hypothetical protein
LIGELARYGAAAERLVGFDPVQLNAELHRKRTEFARPSPPIALRTVRSGARSERNCMNFKD